MFLPEALFFGPHDLRMTPQYLKKIFKEFALFKQTFMEQIVWFV